MHPVRNCHYIKSCHPPVKQYITTHHNIEFIIPVYNFVFVIPKSEWQGPRCVLFCSLYTVYWPVSSSGYLPWIFPPSLSPFLPRSSLAPIPRSVAPSLLRSLPSSPLSLAPSMPTYLPHSSPSSTIPPFLHSRSHTPSHHRFLTPSPCSLPPHPPVIQPSVLLPCLPPCLPASRRPIQCTPYVCLACCTVLCSAYPCVTLRQLGVRARWRCRVNGPLLRSANVPPSRIRFWRRVQHSTIDTCNEYDINTVDASTFPWESAATHRAFYNESQLGPKIGVYPLIIIQ